MTSRSPVLFVSNHGEIVGGGEISLLALLHGLDRARWAPGVVVPSRGTIEAKCSAMGLSTHIIPLPSFRRPGPALLTSLAALRRLIRRQDVTLLHANGSRAMFYADVAGRLSGRPVLWHVRVADRDPLWTACSPAWLTPLSSTRTRWRDDLPGLGQKRSAAFTTAWIWRVSAPGIPPQTLRRSRACQRTGRWW